jgi:hypothetical protein
MAKAGLAVGAATPRVQVAIGQNGTRVLRAALNCSRKQLVWKLDLPVRRYRHCDRQHASRHSAARCICTSSDIPWHWYRRCVLVA